MQETRQASPQWVAVDRQWVATYDRAVDVQDALAPVAASAGMVVGIDPAPGREGGFMVSVEYERPWCPHDCGCRLGPDAAGHHDADRRGCTCDGPCTEED